METIFGGNYAVSQNYMVRYYAKIGLYSVTDNLNKLHSVRFSDSLQSYEVYHGLGFLHNMHWSVFKPSEELENILDHFRIDK